MEHNGNICARASTDEQASPSISTAGELPAPPPDDPKFATEAEADAWWAGVTHGLRCATGEIRRGDDEPPAPRSPREDAAEVFEPSGRRLRVDGWLPWKKARFLLALVAGGVVADACRAVGMSVASAYALKNRRSGRAFGKMWDAIMIHRARSRLADNTLSRAMNGCVEQVLKDGIVVAERRRFDNRLSMAMLTRLDRLAESGRRAGGPYILPARGGGPCGAWWRGNWRDRRRFGRETSGFGVFHPSTSLRPVPLPLASRRGG